MTATGSAGATAPGEAWRSYAMLTLVMLLWAGNLIVGRAVRGDIPPFTLALLRWTGAALVALPFGLRHVVADRAALLAGWRPLLVLGLTGVAAFNALVYSGLRLTTATNGLLLLAAIPAMVLLFNRLLFAQRSSAMQVGGVILSTIGVIYIVLRGAPAAVFALDYNGGDLLILCAVLCWAAYTSLLRLRPQSNPWSFLLVTFAIGIVGMIPFAAMEAEAVAAMTWNGKVVAAVAYVAVLPSLVAYLLYNAAVQAIGAGRAGQTISLMPLFGSLLAALLLGEALHGYHFWGMGLILAGICVAALPSRR